MNRASPLQRILDELGFSDIGEFVNNLERLYVEAPDKVVDLYGILSTKEKSTYPQIAVFVGRYMVDRSKYELAREAFRFALDTYQAQNDQFGVNRVRIYIAFLAFNQNDLDYCNDVVQDIIKTSDDLSHLMAAWHMSGNILKAQGNADEAAEAYKKALSYANRAELSLHYSPDRRKLVTLDKVQIIQRLTDLYIEEGMIEIATTYQLQAAELSRLIQADSPRHAIWILMRHAQLWERRGKLEQAIKHCDEAEELADKYQQIDRLAQIHTIKGRLLGKLGHDDRARDMFDSSTQLSLENNREFLLEKARNQIYLKNSQKAKHLLKQARFLPEGEKALSYQLKMLEVAISCLEKNFTVPYRSELEEAIRFFDERNMLVESSEVKLILAWASVIERRGKTAHDFLEDCLRDCKELGHVTHIWRWYMLSLKQLIKTWHLIDNGYIQQEIETLCREAQAVPLYDNGIRVYGFGRPQLIVGDENHFKQIRYDSKHVPLMMLFMLRGEIQTINQITQTIWSDYDFQAASDSFHALRRANVLGELIKYDAHEGIYQLDVESITYADIWHFRDLMEQAYRERDPAVRILLYRTALAISEEPLAAGIDHPFIVDERDVRAFERARVIQTILNLQNRLRKEMTELPIPDRWITELDQATLSFGVVKPLS